MVNAQACYPMSIQRIALTLLAASLPLIVACSGQAQRSAAEPRDAQYDQSAQSAATRDASAGRPARDAGEPIMLARADTSRGGQRTREATLNPDHPDRYTVQRGDTLWDIAARFLNEPWFWPEIWQVNPQIDNPHLIFPGDVISLVYIDGEPRLMLERGRAERLSPRVREERIEDAIPTIPYEAIRAFLTRPGVLAREQVDGLPYVLQIRGGRLMAGAGQDLYVRGLANGEVGEYYSVVRIGDELVDPDDRRVLGYQSVYTGRGELRRSGDPATVFLTDSARETVRGSRLLPEAVSPGLNFMPRAPETDVEGRVIAVSNGVSRIGPWMVVAINRGERHGLAPGHVLEVWEAGEEVRDTIGGRSGRFGELVRLPDEYAATMMVFETFDRMSYGLVMDAVTEFRVHDTVRSPARR